MLWPHRTLRPLAGARMCTTYPVWRCPVAPNHWSACAGDPGRCRCPAVQKDEELARLQLELAAVAAERDQLRMNVGGGALANAAASAPAPLRLRPRHRSAGPRLTPGVPEAEPQRHAGAIDSPFASALPFALE